MSILEKRLKEGNLKIIILLLLDTNSLVRNAKAIADA